MSNEESITDEELNQLIHESVQESLDEVREFQEPEPPVAAVVPEYIVNAAALQAGINLLAELPYKQVGDVLNVLRQARKA